MDVDIHAHYVVELTTPFDIDPSLKHIPAPIEFMKDGYAIELKLGLKDREWHDPLLDGSLEYGITKSLIVDIHGRGIVPSSNMASTQIDESTRRSCEGILIETVRQYVTWVRVKTNQALLDDRFAIRSYNVRFCQPDGTLIEEHIQRNPDRRFLSLHPDDAYSGLSVDDWNSVTRHFTEDDVLPRLDRLLVESRALLAARFHMPALVLVVSALEDLERMWLEGERYSDVDKQKFLERKLRERIREIATEERLNANEKRLIAKMITIRHENIHERFIEPRHNDVMSLIHITLKLTRKLTRLS